VSTVLLSVSVSVLGSVLLALLAWVLGVRERGDRRSSSSPYSSTTKARAAVRRRMLEAVRCGMGAEARRLPLPTRALPAPPP